ncbi:MAG: heme ABC exporter ATP-binding protein CcmA [Gammaproteobacteria bacterium]|nr:heme ABC exporter ATP-binding protein CcmA [Gammaproteobacteria bacterium]HJL79613.1 heme ABC exporter ATP-binding protein CcmA [Gammaproteobacteria bacterium]HJM09120.1 heme ABC exporter ATP-binding protein CcmA [Gammaproteobacteria bacterium]
MQNACLYRDDTPIFIDIDFHIGSGQHALIKGANGSGKTSLIRAICGFTELNRGRISWNQTSIDNIDSFYQEGIAYLGHKNGLISEISATDNLSMNPIISDLSGLEELISGFNLDSVMHKPVEILSSGQAKKVALISLILSRRSIWIMDEPFANLDDASKGFLSLKMDLHLKAGGMIIRTSNQGDISQTTGLEIALES